SIGLILALTIFSSTAFYVDNSKQQIIGGFFEDQALDLRSDIVINGESKDIPINTGLSSNLEELVEKTRQDLDIRFFRNISSYSTLEGFYGPGLDYYREEDLFNENNKSITVFELTPKIKQELITWQSKESIFSGSTVPQSTDLYNEVYLLYTFQFVKSQNATNPFNLSYSGQDYAIFDHFEWGNKYNLTVLGGSYFEPSYSSEELYSSELFREFPELFTLTGFSRSDIMLFTTDLHEFSKMAVPVLDSNTNIAFYRIMNSLRVNINFNWDIIDAYEASSTINVIHNFRAVLYSFYYSNPFLDGFYVESYSTNILSQAQSIANGVIYNLLTISLPVIILTVFVTNFSFGLVHKNIVRQIGIFKMRGATSRLILGFQLLDNSI
ncbi:MAG: hypothetical protein ACC656_13165, partial [Candidatus Heimdallarchaeota archaeon]